MPKTMGGWIGFGLKVGGAVVAAGPLINSVATKIQQNYPQQIPQEILYEYTGIGYGNYPGFNVNQLWTGIGSLAGGVGLVYIGKLLSKAIR